MSKINQLNYTFFCGYKSPFSNFHQIAFIYRGVHVNSSEQAFMLEKAVMFKDREATIKLQAPNLRGDQAKRIGREVKNFNPTQWAEVRDEIMLNILRAKFTNPEMKAFLMNTYNSTLIEAAPWDKYWGAGMSEENIIKNDFKYNGKNLLGKTLMIVRDEIRAKK